MSLVPFLLAALVLALTPGPGITYVVARTVAGGRREGLASCLGTALGGLVHVAAAALGLSALLAQSATAFSVVKWVGVAYLVYLGLRLLRQSARSSTVEAAQDAAEGAPVAKASEVTASGSRRALLEGIAVEALNVKTALFFLAFLPQFVDASQPLAPQLALLGCVVVVFNTVADAIAVLLAHALLRAGVGGAEPGARTRWMQRFSGGTMLGLAAYMALARRAG